jgi:sulfatase modifying factor 1
MLFAASIAIEGCGRTNNTDDSMGSGGAAQSGGRDSRDSGGASPHAGGALSGGGSESGGSGGDDSERPLEPTADCIHPEVIEQCEGDLCRIEAGCFIMGAPPAEFGRALVNADQVQVNLTHPFWIGRTEVTRAQWSESGLSLPELKELNGERECLEPDCPQSNATFYDMLRYLNRLSEMEELEPCYQFEGSACTGSILTDDYVCPQVLINAASPYECEGYRLPMEAEWEYAARAGSKTAFPTGDITTQRDPAGCYFDAALDAIGWYCMNSPDQAQQVGQKPPNDWGLHDVHGNVSELVNDLYSPSGYLSGPYGAGAGPLIDPSSTMTKPNDITKTDDQDARIQRGGTHVFSAVNANVSRRDGIPDRGSASNLGFRIARTIHE